MDYMCPIAESHPNPRYGTLEYTPSRTRTAKSRLSCFTYLIHEIYIYNKSMNLDDAVITIRRKWI